MPTTTSILLSKAISLGLSESERALITPPLLAQLAAGRHITLTPTDRRRMPKTTLAILAISGFIELTRYERDSFSPYTLVMLALSGRAELKDSELVRLSADLQLVVKNKRDETGCGSGEEKFQAKINKSKQQRVIDDSPGHLDCGTAGRKDQRAKLAGTG